MGMPPLRIGTDCSGLETPLMALLNLGVVFAHIFACDCDAYVKRTIKSNFPPEKIYDDITTRNNKNTPKVDLYIAGFPCQPFSQAGKQRGFGDEKGRGTIFWQVRDYINAQRPTVFVLENVSRLVTMQGGTYYNDIMESLEGIGKKTYTIQSKVINTADHGIPHNRERVYIIGIRRDADNGSFSFPEPVKAVRIEAFLDPKPSKVNKTLLPPRSATTARRNAKLALRRIRNEGNNPFAAPYICDIDSTTPRSKHWLGRSPCITCNRAGGRAFWVTDRARRLTMVETMKLQGITPPKNGFKVAVPVGQLARQIGNAMSVNVLERLLVRILPAAGLVKASKLQDRWEQAAAKNRRPRSCRLKRLKSVFGHGGGREGSGSKPINGHTAMTIAERQARWRAAKRQKSSKA